MKNVYVGQIFGRLKVHAFSHTDGRSRFWRCECECGTFISVPTAHLNNGNTKSCGCLKSDKARARVFKHGGKGTPEYEIWKALKQRCLNARNKAYPQYGARGITVCAEWRTSFEQFRKDMGPRPSDNHSIERMNNNGPYAPWNCRWATDGEQRRNSRQIHNVTISGRTQCLSDWAKELGKDYSTVKVRIKKGMSAANALLQPIIPPKERGGGRPKSKPSA
jgi:hypothetical protein